MGTGTVRDFDDAAGLGTLVTDDGRTFPFHCTQVTDGTRTIAPGTRVAFRPWPRYGRVEAAAVTPLA